MLIPFSSKSKKKWRAKACTLFRLSLVGKEERQNSNCGVNFSQKFQRNGRAFCRRQKKRTINCFFLCENLKNQQYFWASHFHKNVTGERLCFEKNKNTFPFCCLWEMWVTKSLEFLVAVFPIFVNFPNDQCAFNTGALVQLFFTKM